MKMYLIEVKQFHSLLHFCTHSYTCFKSITFHAMPTTIHKQCCSYFVLMHISPPLRLIGICKALKAQAFTIIHSISGGTSY